MKLSGPIVITGFMGCGKSRVARELARRLALPMVDLDERITASEGKTPAQLINNRGESGFRSIESNALQHLLERGVAGVIALGGGAWIEERNREMIDQYRCASVWLDVPFEMCWQRIEASSEERPLGKTRAEALERYERRRPVYELAAIHIHVNPEDTVEELVARIKNELIDARI